jgi:hypothetical protein
MLSIQSLGDIFVHTTVGVVVVGVIVVENYLEIR